MYLLTFAFALQYSRIMDEMERPRYR